MGLGLDALDEDAVQEGGEGLDGLEGCGLGGVLAGFARREEGRGGREGRGVCKHPINGGADRAGCCD